MHTTPKASELHNVSELVHLPQHIQQRVQRMISGEFRNSAYNCFGAVDFVQTQESVPTYLSASSFKGKKIEFNDLCTLNIAVPFGIQFIGPNIRYEDSFDEVGKTVIEPIHEAIALKKEGEQITIFEKRGGEEPAIRSLLESWKFYNSLCNNELCLQIFSINN